MGRILLGLLLATLAVAAQAQSGVATGEDYYLAGGALRISRAVPGDLLVAGGNILVEASVGEDLMAAGSVITLGAPIGDDVRAAAGQLLLSAAVGGDAVLAGGGVELGPRSRVGGHLMVWAGEANLAGEVAGPATITGRRVRLEGTFLQPVEVNAERLEVAPGARLRGGLSYRSPAPAQIAEQARIDGRLIHHRVEEPPAALRFLPAIAVFLGLLAALLIFYLLFPRASLFAARMVGAAPWRSLALGLALLVTIPFAVVLLMMSVVGVLVALLLALLYMVFLVAGLFTGLIYAADGLVRRTRATEPGKGVRSAAVAGVLLVFALVQLVPFLGGLVAILTLTFGLGALGLWLARLYTAPAALRFVNAAESGRTDNGEP